MQRSTQESASDRHRSITHRSTHRSSSPARLVFAVLLASTSACGPQAEERQEPVRIQLAALVSAGAADLRSMPAELILGEPGAAAYLPSGWNVPRSFTTAAGEERRGMSTRGSAAVIEVPIAAPLDLAIELTTHSTADQEAPLQFLTALWNDAKVERYQVSQGEGVLTVPIPAGLQRRGVNTLTLLPHVWTPTPAGVLLNGDVDPGVVVESIRFSLLGRTVHSGPTPRAVESSILQAPGTVASVSLLVPEGARLRGAVRWADAAAHDAGAVSITAVEDGEQEQMLASWPAATLTSGSHSFDLDLGAFAGRAIALNLVATASSTEPNADGEIEWEEPTIEGTRQRVAMQRAAPPKQAPNIVMILFDTLRADFTEPYGSTWVKTPRMASLAASGVTFTKATSNAASTRPSVATLLTGLYPPVHNVDIIAKGMSDAAPYLPVMLKEAGYRTIGLSNNPHISEKWGFSRGFDVFTELFDIPEHDQLRFHASPEELASTSWETYVAGALPQGSGQPFFLYLHEIDPHFPYDAPPPYDQAYVSGYRGALTDNPMVHAASWDLMALFQAIRLMEELNRHRGPLQPADIAHLKARYAAEVSYMDSYLGWLVDKIAARQDERETLFVFLSDHGEQFYEHGYWTHGPFVYQEDIQVPFILSLPGTLPRGHRTDAHAELVDVVPTILDLLGIPATHHTQGRSLLPFAFAKLSQRDDDPAFAYGDPRFHRSEDKSTVLSSISRRAVRVRQWKLVERTRSEEGSSVPGFELYDLETDPGETVNLWPARPIAGNALLQVLRLQDAIDAEINLDAPIAEIDEATRNRLRALGYLD